MRSALNNKTLKDGLSGPLSIASMILNWMVYNSKLVATVSLDALETEEPLHIVVVGATAVYEEVRISILSVLSLLFAFVRTYRAEPLFCCPGPFS